MLHNNHIMSTKNEESFTSNDSMLPNTNKVKS